MNHIEYIALEERYFQRRQLNYFDNSKILFGRFGYAINDVVTDSGVKCNMVYSCKDKTQLGIIPRLRLCGVWDRACLDPEGLGKIGISMDEWLENMKKLSELFPKGDSPVLVQDIWGIKEFDFQHLFLKKAHETIELIRFAVLQDMAETERLLRRWKKIKNYPFKVSLGEVFEENDIAILNANGIYSLNQVKGAGILKLKDMFLEHSYSRLPEELNAAFREDKEKRKDKLFKVFPFALGTASLVLMAVVAYIYKYTLLKNTPMTVVIFVAVGLWIYAMLTMVWGICRAVRRRKKRPDYVYFDKDLRFVVCVFAVLALFSIGSVSFFYERYDGYDDVFYYRNIGDGKIAIAGLVDDSVTEIDIPSRIDGKLVTEIAGWAFRDSNLKKVDMTNSIKKYGNKSFYRCGNLSDFHVSRLIEEVGNKAFADCDSLETLEFGVGLTKIGNSAFEDCDALQNVAINGALLELGKAAFKSCDNLNRVYVEDNENLLRINDNTFNGCRELKDVQLCNSATHIGKSAFRDCSSLTELTISKDADYIGKNAFKNCTSLERVSVPFIGKKKGKNKKYDFCFNGEIREITITGTSGLAKEALAGLSKLEKVVLGEDVSEIGQGAFKNCSGLCNVEILGKITTVPDNAFENCASLISVSGGDFENIGKSAFSGCKYLVGIGLENVKNIGEKGFCNCESLSEIELPAAENVGKNAFLGCSSFRQFKVPETLSKIGERSFAGTGLIEVEFAPTVTTIGNGAFADNHSLGEADLSMTSASLGKSVFENCQSLQNVKLPAGTEIIPEKAFKNCFSLGRITIPEGVRKVESEAFNGCCLSRVILPYSLREIGAKAFANMKSTEEIFVPELVYKIGANAFAGCGEVKDVTLPFIGKSRSGLGDKYRDIFSDSTKVINITIADANKIGRYTFHSGKSCLQTIVINRATKVGNNAFEDFDALKTVDLGGTSLESIGNKAFYDCDKLEAVYLPDSLKTIWKSAFSRSALRQLSFGDGITEIKDRAFYNCYNLSQIDLSSLECEMGKYVFSACFSLKSVVLPKNLTKIPDGTFNRCNVLEYFDIPDTVNEIGKEAFSGSDILTLNIPYGVTKIGDSAFAGVAELDNVTIPDSVEKFGKNTFADCGNLKTISMPFLGKNRNYRYDGYKFVFGTGTAVEKITLTSASDIRKKTFHSGKGSLCSVKIYGATKIDKNAFEDFDKLSTVDLSCSSIVSIKDKAFYDCDGLEDVLLPNTLESIGKWAFARGSLPGLEFVPSLKEIKDSAFRNCYSMISVDLSRTECTLGNNIFEACFALKDVRLPKNTTKLPNGIFKSCTDLKTFDITSAIKEIGDEAFRGSGLEAVVLPYGVTSLGSGAFADLTTIDDVFIPITVSKMGKNLFAGCSNLKKITLPFVGNSSKNSKDGYKYTFGEGSHVEDITLTNVGEIKEKALRSGKNNIRSLTIYNADKIGKKAFNGFSKLESIDFTDSPITEIGEKAFYGCSGLTSIEFPKKLQIIGKEAFAGSGLTRPEFDGTALREIRDGAFDGCRGLLIVKLPEDITIGKNLFRNCTSLTEATLPKMIKKIPDGTFMNCPRLTSFNIPYYINEIGAEAFRRTGLTSIYLGNNITKIGKEAFAATSLTEVAIPDSVVEMGKKVFDCCFGLRSVTTPFLGKKRNSIGNAYKYTFGESAYVENIILTDMDRVRTYTFHSGKDCLKSVTLKNTSQVGYRAFAEFSNLQYVDFSQSNLKRIKANAFSQCENLISLVLPNSVTKIGKAIARDCTSLNHVILSSSLEKIPLNSFRGCTSLDYIDIPDSVTKIGKSAFYECHELRYVHFGVGLEIIGVNAFRETAVADLSSLPRNLSKIKKNAFRNDNALISVNLPHGLEKLGKGAFSCCRNLESIVIPKDVKKIGADILWECDSLKSIELPFIGKFRWWSKKMYYLTDCNTITDVKITNARKIRREALAAGCSHVKNLYLNPEIKKIGYWAFHGCSPENVYISRNVYNKLYEDAFPEETNIIFI